MSLSKYSESEINELITPWKITKELGSGASGLVFEIARGPVRGALKVIPIPSDESEIEMNRARGMSDEEISAYYRDVADNIISTIQTIRSFGNQKNIVNYSQPAKFINSDNIGWTVFVPMELLQPIDTVFPKGEIPNRKEVIRLGIEVCDALQVCHEGKLMHRDIKPENILIDGQGNYKIVDFGIARIKEKTITNISARGTENYMAPEIIKKETSHSNDFTADLYSLGIVLFELLNDGRFPTNPDFPSLKTSEDNTRFIHRKMNGDLPFIAKHEDGSLIDIIAKASDADISERYRSAEEMKSDLMKALEEPGPKPLPAKKERKTLTFGQYAGEPIKWIVLEEDADEILLLSEKILDAKEFHSENTKISWSKSTLRSWLNGYGAGVNDYGLDYTENNFIDEAFSQDEKERLTEFKGDKVRLLATEDVYETERAETFGFCIERIVADPNRVAETSAFAVENGLRTEGQTGCWWLKTQGTENNRAMFVDSSGIVCFSGATVFDRSFGVRPVIRLCKSKTATENKHETIFEGWNYVTEEIGGKVRYKKLGEGGFGDVFEIEKEGMSDFKSALKIVSIPKDKMVLSDYAADGMNREQIMQALKEEKDKAEDEIRLQSEVKDNPNIVRIEDYAVREKKDDIGWEIYIRMELLTPISQRLVAIRKGEAEPYSEEEVRKLGADICNALEECHGMNMLHRDIKPENIFKDKNGNYKLGDFGISRTMDKTTGIVSGTKTDLYAAPEVVRMEKHRVTADIYSLGLVMYEMLNLRLPFLPEFPNAVRLSDREEAMQKRLSGEWIKPIKNISDDMNRAVLKACEFDPENRYPTAKAMKERLLGVPAGPAEKKRDKEPGKKNKARIPIIIFIFIVAAGGLGWAITQMFTGDPENKEIVQEASSVVEQELSGEGEETTEAYDDVDLSEFPEYTGKKVKVSSMEELKKALEISEMYNNESKGRVIELEPGNYNNDGSFDINTGNVKIVGVGDSKPVFNCPIALMSKNIMLENINVRIDDAVRGDSGDNGILVFEKGYLRNVDVDIPYTTQYIIFGISGYAPVKMEGCKVNVNYGNQENVAVNIGDAFSVKNCELESNGTAFEFFSVAAKKVSQDDIDYLVSNNKISARTNVFTNTDQ